MDRRGRGRSYDTKRNFGEGNSGFAAKRGAYSNRKPAGYFRSGANTEHFVPETQYEQKIESDEDENQDSDEAQADFRLSLCHLPGIGILDLKFLDLWDMKKARPNAQVMMCKRFYVRNPKIDMLIIEMETMRKPEELSAITHLGFSDWLTLVPVINKVGPEWEDASKIMEEIYQELPIYRWTIEEDNAKEQFFRAVPTHEKDNKIKKSCLNKVLVQRMVQKQVLDMDDDPFGESLLTEEEKTSFFGFTLHNCLIFPIMPERLVEGHAMFCNPVIWCTKTFGALAPISRPAWIMLVEVTPEQENMARTAAERMEKVIDKERIKLKIDHRFFDKRCNKDDCIYVRQKGHMDYSTIPRDNFYLKRV